MGNPFIPIVAGVLCHRERLFIARKPDGKHHAGLWEFPGGKIEFGESPEEALAREFREEFEAKIKVGPVYTVVAHSYDGQKTSLLLFYWAVPVTPPENFNPREHSDTAWIAPSDLGRYAFPAADADVAIRLSQLPGSSLVAAW